MQRTDLVGHLNLSAVFTHRVFKSELIGLIKHGDDLTYNLLVNIK
jgi:hypothetical protein